HRDRDVSDEKQHQAAPPARTRLSAASVHVPLPSPAKRIPPSGSVGASPHGRRRVRRAQRRKPPGRPAEKAARPRGELPPERNQSLTAVPGAGLEPARLSAAAFKADRKSTRLNSSHVKISYAVFCLKKKNQQQHKTANMTPLQNDKIIT